MIRAGETTRASETTIAIEIATRSGASPKSDETRVTPEIVDLISTTTIPAIAMRTAATETTMRERSVAGQGTIRAVHTAARTRTTASATLDGQSAIRMLGAEESIREMSSRALSTFRAG